MFPNEKKRHHYITITYLDKFTDNDGEIVAYRKDDVRTVLHLRPEAIAFGNYYYSQPLPEGGRDNNRFEDYFSTVETPWPKLVGRLRGHCGGPKHVVESVQALLTPCRN